MALLVIAAFKLWLVSAVEIFGETLAHHDDLLFVNLAANLIQGHWLGDYNLTTLIKGPGFSFWLAFLHGLHVPLILGNTALSIMAAAVFSWAVHRLTGNYLLALFCYAVLVFNVDINHRVVRESLYAPLTLLLFSLITLQLVYYAKKRELSLIGVFIFSGLLAWYWVIREEGIWIIPSLLLNAGVFAYLIYCEKKYALNVYIHLFLLTLPFIALLLGNTIIANINDALYQSKNVVEMKSDAFLGAYGSLSRVNPEARQRLIPVTKASRAEIYKISPAYREISPYLDAPNVGNSGCLVYPSTCGEIAGGWFMWVFRIAVFNAGYYKNGATASDYYWRLKKEIDSACEQKLLTCANERNSLLPIIDRDDIANIFNSFVRGAHEIIHPVIYQPESMRPYLTLQYSHGTSASLEYFSKIIYGAIAPLDNTDMAHNQTIQNNLQIKILLDLSKFYGVFFTPLLLVSLLFFVYKIKSMLNNKSVDLLWIINSSLLLAIISRLMILAIIDATSFPGIDPLYLSPIYPLTLLFILINIVNFFKPYYLTSLTNDSSSH
ncbi:MAG: hypothetical protein NTV00_02260 [Methylococcales bacterium]|nr:hypothetical protein [Methylococcales bacterium]